jgi:hypothetical protein
VNRGAAGPYTAPMKFTAYIGFTFEAEGEGAARAYAERLVRALDWPSTDPDFEERLVESVVLDRVTEGDPAAPTA